MTPITDTDALATLYGAPNETSLRKVTDHLTPAYRRWIERSRFCLLSTVGPEGTDGSPRGDDGMVVLIKHPRRLLMPDWRGNNRIDSLRNIVRDGRVSLMFMVPGSSNVIRVNGRAFLTADEAALARFTREGRNPRSVIVIDIAEVYSQCARAIIRAGLWRGRDESFGLPTVGEMMAEITDGALGGADYGREWPARADKTMW